MKAAVSTLMFALTFTSFSCAQLPLSESAVDFGLLHDDSTYHSLCDKGTDGPLNANGLPVPRACFVSPYHVSGNLRDPVPSSLNGFIDDSGKGKLQSSSFASRARPINSGS